MAATVLLDGRPAAATVGFARDEAVDLLVVGSHGRTGLRRPVAGSVAEEVVRTAPCAVLVVRPAASRPPAA
jgi:nucleotide-binding universal stress UspA family protein